MGWSSLSFPFGSLLTAAKMTQVYSNFASLVAQESGAPHPGVWDVSSGISAPQVSSFGTLNVTGALTGPGAPTGGLRAWGYVSQPGSNATTHSLQAGVNLASSRQTTGVYVLAFSNAMTTSVYAVAVAGVGKTPGVQGFPLIFRVDSQSTARFFVISVDPTGANNNTTDAGCGFMVMVMGV
jgi:hypothetical protein